MYKYTWIQLIRCGFEIKRFKGKSAISWYNENEKLGKAYLITISKLVSSFLIQCKVKLNDNFALFGLFSLTSFGVFGKQNLPFVD